MKYDLNDDNQRGKFFAYLSKLEKSKCVVELKKINPTRSNLQNRYLHAIIGIFANDEGFTIKQAKTVLKDALKWTEIKKGKKVYLETSEMDTKELSDKSEEMRVFLNEHGYNVPTPEMFRLMQYEIENQVEQGQNNLL